MSIGSSCSEAALLFWVDTHYQFLQSDEHNLGKYFPHYAEHGCSSVVVVVTTIFSLVKGDNVSILRHQALSQKQAEKLVNCKDVLAEQASHT